MFRKTIVYSSLFVMLLCSTSCFEILEEINLNADGSGSMLVTLNMSKSKTKVASIMLLDSINGYKIPTEDDMNEAMKDVVSHLEKTDGISNIKKTKDMDNYVFTIACDFKKVEHINAIFKDLIEKQNRNGGTSFTTENFTFNGNTGTFLRNFKYDSSIKKSFARLNDEDKKIFDDASYTCIYRFKDAVKSVSNENAKIAPNKKAVMLRVDAMSFITGAKNVQNKIQLTR
ncbi:hypothetical protein FGM00_18495 [Aggregatimonas sangjinii]|uniref:Lipoprotein n=1 Tax=Aggregatimonas sangjinii TaxID=2583587 RepID=A0A5B7ST99_9FLAO|nr:hypothetical protein [Aggregatimonas sangjinii]QCX02005.1 hypothetical protein FGM00_18495 [Aggregatimonas sangjinii]